LSDVNGSFSSPRNIGTSDPDSLFLNATIPSNLPAGAGYLIRVVSGNNPNAAIGTANFTVRGRPKLFNLTRGANSCSGGGGVTFGLLGSQIGVQYQLFRGNGVAVGSSKQGTGFAISFDTANAPDTYFVLATDSVGCQDTMTGRLKINPAPERFTLGGGADTTCVSAFSVTLDSSETGVSYQLFRGVQFTGRIVNGTGSALSFNSLFSSGRYTIQARNVQTGCTSRMDSFIVATTPVVNLLVAPTSNCDTILDRGLIAIALNQAGSFGVTFNGQEAVNNGNNVFRTTAANPPLNGPNVIEVTDSSGGCNVATIPVSVGTLNPVSATLYSKTSASCNPNDTTIAEIIIDARNGPTPYTYNLFNQAGDTLKTQNSNRFTGVDSGTYSVVVEDTRGCKDTVDNIVIRPSIGPTATLYKKTAASCGNDGTITVIGIGGKAPYKYSLIQNGTAVKSQTSNTFTGLAAGTYSVAVEDSKHCADTTSEIVIPHAAALTAQLHGLHRVSCTTGTDGSINVIATGGVPPYQYSLTRGPVTRGYQTYGLFGKLPAGNYVATVKDSKGCTDSTNTFTLTSDTVECSAIVSGSPAVSAATSKMYGALKVQAMPNPSRADFTLNMQSRSKERVQIIVTDMFGKQLYQTVGSADQRYTFGKDLKPGMYIVKVIQGKEIQTLKLVKGN